jgi:Holliday junction resolvasome RuvABC endonuclease subunit
MPEKEVLISISKKSRKFGAVVLTENRLIYYNQNWLATKWKSPEKTAAEITAKLISTYRPTCLVTEQLTFKQQHIPSSIKARQTILDVAKKNQLAIKEYSLSEARASLSSGIKATKDNVARILISRYPEFKRFRPNEAGWQIAHYQPLFNALTLGFHFFNDKKDMSVTS